MRLIDSLATTEALSSVFSDVAVLQALLDVEAALARVQARLGLIPAAVADAVGAAARADFFDAGAIAEESRRSGTVVVPLVAALTERVRAADSESAGFVHWGATSQDISDTALVLRLQRAHAIVAVDHGRLMQALRRLSDAHARTVMLGRTLLQPSPPTTFGLKAAGWFASAARSWTRLTRSSTDAAVVQFGGASGTLAALDTRGRAVAKALADELGLTCPDAPWHAHRDRLAALVASYGVYTGGLGKIARDISLLMQIEVGEVAERGGTSSTLPHKKNPSGSAIVLAAATRLPGLVASFLTGMVQEHERSAGSWHAEWPTMASAVQATGSAAAAMADAVEGLTVNPVRMRANIDAANGAAFSERLLMRLAPLVGRDTAHRLVGEAFGAARAAGRSFGETIRATPEIARHLAPGELDDLETPEAYLGVAEELRTRLLAGTSG